MHLVNNVHFIKCTEVYNEKHNNCKCKSTKTKPKLKAILFSKKTKANYSSGKL